jgi:cysteinyl-tRNA synthetase
MKSTGVLFLSVVLLCLQSCADNDDAPSHGELDYRQKMREFVIGISKYARSMDTSFLIIPQNGIELVSTGNDGQGPPHEAYLDAIDGNGQEDLFYGYNKDDNATPTAESEYLISLLDMSKGAGNTILVTDYCSTPSNINNSYAVNSAHGYVSFAANHRELNAIPDFPKPVYAENSDDISSLAQVKNFLYLINPDQFIAKEDFIQAVSATNYDLLVMDLFFGDGDTFTAAEIMRLKIKANGGKRMVICYMSIGEAENYRYYWRPEWAGQKPSWMDAENPDWEGNFKVHYWDPEWQDIIYGNDTSYLRKILDAGFDGAYLDIIDAFEYYE